MGVLTCKLPLALDGRLADLAKRLNSPYLVVREHDADEDGLVGHGLRHVIRIDAPRSVAGNMCERDLTAIAPSGR